MAHIRDGLDGFRFFELRSRPPAQTAFVLVEPLWELVEPDDEFRMGAWDRPVPHRGAAVLPGYYSGDDGGRVVHVSRTAADAAARVELTAEGRPLPDYHWVRRWVPGWWLGGRAFPGEMVGREAGGLPPAFVHEVEYDATGGPPVRDAVFVVRRLGWRLSHTMRLFTTAARHLLTADDVDTQSGRFEPRAVPEVACSRPEAAEARATALTRSARLRFPAGRRRGDPLPEVEGMDVSWNYTLSSGVFDDDAVYPPPLLYDIVRVPFDDAPA